MNYIDLYRYVTKTTFEKKFTSCLCSYQIIFLNKKRLNNYVEWE